MRVIKLKDGCYVLICGRHAIHGNLARMVVIMAELKCRWDEIEEGFASMERNGHNMAEFGINGTFIFSKKIEN